MKRNLTQYLSAALVCVVVTAASHAQTTVFTYQG